MLGGGSGPRLVGLVGACSLLVLAGVALAGAGAPPADVAIGPASAPLAQISASTPSPASAAASPGRDVVTRRQAGPLGGQTVPDFTFRTFGGGVARLSDFRGKPVVLNLWASWCPSCPGELQYLNNLSAVLYDRVRIVTVAVMDNERPARGLIEQLGTGFTTAGIDLAGDADVKFLLLGPPATFVIDPDGRVAVDWRGPVDQVTLLDALRVTYPEIVIPAAGDGKGGRR